MLNIGILGCGRIGQVHARSISQIDSARIAAVADAFPETANSLAKRSDSKVSETDDLINDDSIDAVVIGTPTDTHYDLIHAAAHAGKAIFCEKPVDMSADRIRTCIKVVEATGVPFMSAFNRRFDPNFANIQSRIKAGEIGDVEIVTILSRDPTPPPISYIKTSGGLFRDMMIHDLDMARFMLGEEPVDIYAVGSALVDPAIGEAGDVDTAAVILTTASGKVCQISNSRRASYGYDQRLEIHGSKGMLRAENVLESTVQVATEKGFQNAPAQHFFLERYEEAYRAEMAYFVQQVQAGEPLTPGIRDGLQAQVLADSATLSSQNGERIILSPDSA